MVILPTTYNTGATKLTQKHAFIIEENPLSKWVYFKNILKKKKEWIYLILIKYIMIRTY